MRLKFKELAIFAKWNHVISVFDNVKSGFLKATLLADKFFFMNLPNMAKEDQV